MFINRHLASFYSLPTCGRSQRPKLKNSPPDFFLASKNVPQNDSPSPFAEHFYLWLRPPPRTPHRLQHGNPAPILQTPTLECQHTKDDRTRVDIEHVPHPIAGAGTRPTPAIPPQDIGPRAIQKNEHRTPVLIPIKTPVLDCYVKLIVVGCLINYSSSFTHSLKLVPSFILTIQETLHLARTPVSSTGTRSLIIPSAYY